MNDKQEPIIDADAVEEIEPSKENTEESIKPKKKWRIKFHLFLMVVLGVGTWIFWTFSPEAQQIRLKFEETVSSYQGVSPAREEPPVANTEQTEEPIGASISIPNENIDSSTLEETKSPLFDASENSGNTPVDVSNPVDSDNNMPPQTETITFANESELLNTMQNLQKQVSGLTQVVINLQQQQQQWSQQQVRAQLFALLQKAASPKNSLGDKIIAWKGIELLPLLSQDKRNTANQAFLDLQDVQQRIQQTNDDISSLITTLAAPLQANDLKEVAQEVGNVIDPYQQSDAFDSWLDWMKQQFTITKLDKHALELSDDPYADLKQLITELNHLQTSIHQHNWGNIGSLTSLLYQLEQRGLEASFSQESIAQLQHDINIWQQEAQTWMVQL
ncbi:MAG: hypothetical protein Q9M46_02670 [Ghiorsea sp.]|nr:hypothetical protein [Ghiorsea sp.]